MSFDFRSAVDAPFRMQPGLRRLAPGLTQLTPLIPGSPPQREKLAVFSAFWPQALCAQPGFDATAALQALSAHAGNEHPQVWRDEGRLWQAPALGTAVDGQGEVVQTRAGAFGLGDEIARCLRGLPEAWRRPALLSLAFAEDFAIVDGRSGTIPWLAVALPSHWAPETKVGHHFSTVHAPVADNDLLLRAGAGLMRMVAAQDAQARWERFVWNVTDHPRLHAHPARVDPQRWQGTAVADAWWRTERQTFIPVPAPQQAVFTIHVALQPLASAVAWPWQASALHAAIATMSPAVLAYRHLAEVRAPLLAWLAARM